MAYYYLVGQLPGASYSTGAPITSARCRELCLSFMQKADYELLDRCVLNPVNFEPSGSPLIDAWTEWEHSLRLNLARLRAGKINRDSSSLPEAMPYPLDAAAAAKQAMSIESPLEAEQFLDRARWAMLDSFSGIDYFSRDTVYAYYLKLLLLERKALFREEEGFAEYKAIYASIMEAVPTSNVSGEPK